MSRGVWTEENVAGHPCHVYTPPQRSPAGFVVIYLHGVHLQTLHGHTAFTDEFDRHGLVCVTPMAGPTWWTERLTPAFDSNLSAAAHVRKNILPLIQERWQVRPPAVALLGTSMGGQGALRLAYRHPDLFPVVAAISPAIDYHLRIKEGDSVLLDMYGDLESARQDTALLHIHPLNWPRHQFFCCDPADHRWFDSADRLRMKLYSLGVPHVCDLETTGGGHGFDYYNRQAATAIGFLVERLSQEQRRLGAAEPKAE